MRPEAGTFVEAAALAVIAIAIAAGGRATLARFHAIGLPAEALLAVGLITTTVWIRRALRAGGERLELTRGGAYLTGLILALWATLAPARWNLGAAIAALEVAVIFDLFVRLSGRR